MKNLLFLFFAIVALTGCQAQQNGKELVSPDVFESKIKDAEQLIDVRTPKEYKNGHIADAVNMHIYDKDFDERLDTLDKTKTVYVYCKLGGRSAEAVEIMQQKGFKHIVELDGGIDAWDESGKPVKK